VVGFDDIPDAKHFWPPLTTIRQDFGEIGRSAVGVLLAEVSGDAVHERVQILPELVIRGTTGRAPGAPATVTQA
jgi:DNA-binding LacI/PurR family transcriptional regulator